MVIGYDVDGKDAVLISKTSEVHRQRLFQLIRNAISFGEWELAKACAKAYKAISVDDSSLERLLLDVLNHPRKYSHGSTSVPTPFHLSWLAFLLYLELYNDEREGVHIPKGSRRLIEFKMFLFTLTESLTPEQQQDIYCYFKLGYNEHLQQEALNSLSNEFRNFLSEFAISSPQNCRTLTNFLVNPSRPGLVLHKRRAVIAECYMRVILSYIGRLQLFEESVQTMLMRECIPMIISAKEYFSPDNMIFINAVTSIVKIIMDCSPADVKLLYSSLIDNESRPFLILALEASWKHRLNQLGLQDLLEEIAYDKEEQKLHVAKLLSKSFEESSPVNRMTAYQICDYYKVHFLDCIINASLEMISRQDYEAALVLLRPKLLRQLIPLVILLAWPKCTSCNSKRKLLDLLKFQKEMLMEPTFGSICERLEFNLEVTHHIFAKENAELNIGKSDYQADREPDTYIFHQMDFHSVLYVINELEILQKYSSEEIMEILANQPSYVSCLPDASQIETVQSSEIRKYLCFCVLRKTIYNFTEHGSKETEYDDVTALKSHISKINPLSYRLETLEDLFSLLFIRKEHFTSSSEQIENYDIAINESAECHVDQSNNEDVENCDGSDSRGPVKENENHGAFVFKEQEIRNYLDILNACIEGLIVDKFSSTDKASRDHILPCSSFDQRVSQLKQNINDAVWRLQLVSGFCSSNEDGFSNNVEKYDTTVKRKQLLSQMLSSPESLLHLCLQNGSVVQAKQVIKMFQLEELPCGLQVNFSESFDGCIEELTKFSPVESTASTKSSQLTNIRSAAAAGLLSTHVRSTLDRLLRHKFVSACENNLIAVAVCFDMVISGELQSAVCKTLLDAADELLKADSNADPLKVNLLSSLTYLKTAMSLFVQLEGNSTINVLNDASTSFSHFISMPYHKKHEGETESSFYKLAEQRRCLEAIVSFMDEDVICTTELSEDKNVDKNPCRKTMNETLAAFTSDNLVLIPKEMPRRNYIKTFFRHVDTLSRLQLYFKTRHSGKQSMKFEQQSSLSGIKAVNPFVILKDDICDIFGRLLFEWSMPPKRLESIAKQVNINLVKVVARNFGLSIPVQRVQNCPDLTTFLLAQPIKVLNDSLQVMEAQDPVAVIESLMQQLLKIISGLPPSYDSYVGSKQIKEIVSSDAFGKFVQTSVSLKFVDLGKLENDNDKLCFMVNLHNVMFFHGVLLIISGTIQGMPDIKASDRSKWTFESLMTNPAGRLAIDQFLAYDVGQIGIISAFNLYRHILEGTSSSYYGDALKARHELFEWTLERLAYAPTTQDKRCIFMLTHASTSCPPLKLLKPENVGKQLEYAAKNYLEKNVSVVKNSNRINIPKLLHWHRGLFLPRQPLCSGLQTASSLDCKDRNILLLKFMMQSSAKLSERLGQISKDNFSFDVASFNWSLNFNLDIDQKKKPTKEPTKLSRKEISSKRQFSLSEPMKKYLYEASPVSASVICMAVEKKQLLDQVGEMIIESKYGGIKMGTQEIFSLGNFIEKGILNVQNTVDASLPFQEYTKIRSEDILRILKCLQVDKPNVSGRYVEHMQSLIKLALSMLDVCGSVNIESSNFLVELVHVFLSHGGMLIANLIEIFPQIFPVVTKDRLLCESIYDTRDRLDDLVETCMVSGEDALKIDLDRIAELKHELKRCLMLLHDPFLRYKMTVDSIIFYEVNEALEILEVCSEGCKASQQLVDRLDQEAAKIRWYDNIQKLATVHLNQSKVSNELKLTRWQDVIDFVDYHPEHVSILLIASGALNQFDFWINNFSVPSDLSKMCLRAKLFDLLKDPKTEYTDVHSELEKLNNKHMTLELCQDVLQSSEVSTNHSLLVLRYMIENLTNIMTEDQCNELLCTELGFKALDRLPGGLKSSYWHLTSKPELILEQLLMNMKVVLAKSVIEVVRACVSETGNMSWLLPKIDELLAIYAEKSLDVPVFEIVSPSKLTSGSPDKTRLSKKHRRNKSGPRDLKSQPQSYNESSKQDDENIMQRSSPSFHEDTTLFEIPEIPVSRIRWISDQSVTTCMICNIQVFSTFNRRHHCRHCGRVCCAECSNSRGTVSGYPTKVRVCKQCFHHVYSTDKRISLKRERKEAVVSDASPMAESLSSLPRCSTPLHTDSDTDNSRRVEHGDAGELQLSLDEDENREIRRLFCFDQAPSASLCIAILEKYSNVQTVGGMLLKFCNDLSKHLNSRDSNKYDMDNTMLVGMIEFLLFNAKVKFMKAGVINGVELCDSYMAHVEVLRLLLNSDWIEIPTMQELSHPESIRRLRDRLVDSERFALAIDVTGKCGLDPGTVWFAWGLSQLKSGDLVGARENFSKCLTPLKGVEERDMQHNAMYLSQIIEIIETSPLLAYAKEDDLLMPLYALQDQLRGSQTSCVLDKSRFDEIMHYLNKYGSHVQFVRFYVRHGLLKRAAAYIRDRKCSDEVFIEDLLVRTFQDGSFETLVREMEDMDPTLNSWKEYLNKSCMYLSRKRLFNCLYQMQLFLKDHFRAATTCVRFFLGESGNPARSFKDLYKRLDYLDRAKKHLETLMKEKAIVKSTFVSHIGSLRTEEASNPPLVQEVPVAELKSHLNTIDLQVKVLNFFRERDKVFNETINGTVPTLFGRGKERADLVSKLLMESISHSFSLVSRIIQDYRLPTKIVFGDCIQRLAQNREYDAIFNLIKMTESTGMITNEGRDQLLFQTVTKIIAHRENAKQANQFIRMIRSQSKKVDALIICGRLKDAYVEALKEDNVQDIERILLEAEKLNQKYVADICQKYLTNYEEKQQTRAKLR